MWCVFLISICFLFLLWQDSRERSRKPEQGMEACSGRHTAVGEIYYRETGSDSVILYVKKVHLTDISANSSPGRLLIYVNHTSDQLSGQFSIGSVIQTEGTITYMVHAGNPGQFDERTFYRARGILWKQYAEEWQIVGRLGGAGRTFAEVLALLRENACDRLELLFPADTAGLLEAMLLGVKTHLPATLSEGFSDMGTGHLLSISGLHFTLLLGTWYRLCRKIPLPGPARLGRLVCLLSVFLGSFAYMQMLGFRVSGMRAGIMLCLLLLAEAVGRSYDRMTAWAVTGLLVTVAQPWALLGSSFWLSFAATGAGVFALEWQEEQKRREKEREWRERQDCVTESGTSFVPVPVKKIAGLIRMPLLIQVVLLPLQLWFFCEVPVYALLWNVLLVPLAGVLLGSGVLALGSFFCVPLGIFLGGPAQAVCTAYRWACEAQKLLPGTVCICGKPALWQMVFYYGVLSGIWICREKEWQERTGNQKKARSGKRRARRCQILYACALLCLLFYRNRPPLAVTFLDVGQGDCAVLRTKGGRTVIMDCGSSDVKDVGTYRLLPYLKYTGTRRVDAVFVSHGDEDHLSGIRELLKQRKIPVNRLICYRFAGEKMESLLQLAKEQGVSVFAMEAGDTWNMEKLQFICLAPGAEDPASDENNRSLVLLAVQEGIRLLFTGDMGVQEEMGMLERWGKEGERILDVDVLKVGHHGSAGSTSPDFLRQVSPELAVISCGKNNRYGHPAPETTGRLKENGVYICETKEDGAVLLRLRDGKMVLNCWRK